MVSSKYPNDNSCYNYFWQFPKLFANLLNATSIILYMVPRNVNVSVTIDKVLISVAHFDNEQMFFPLCYHQPSLFRPFTNTATLIQNIYTTQACRLTHPVTESHTSVTLWPVVPLCPIVFWHTTGNLVHALSNSQENKWHNFW